MQGHQLSLFIILIVSGFFIFAATTIYYPPCRRIDAAVRWLSNNKTYFFSEDEYILHNDQYNAEEDVLPVTQLAEDFPSNVQAAVNWFSEGRSVYFKGCKYYMELRGILRRYRIARLGLPCHVDAALNIDGDRVLIFKGCQYWTITRANRRAVLTGTNDDLGLPCDVDAALTWHNGSAYVIKNDVVWSLTTGRASLDEWNLCSWRICESTDVNSSMHLADEFPCNGDKRFCSLRLDQVTLAGAHNAGSGFDGGFGFLSCWIRNHYMTILEQLRFGIRYLDVDTSWEHCGLLGTFHNFMCGGPVCRMIKQIRRFLAENRHEVLVVNFNHEMRDVQRVIPALIRQLSSQLGLYINSFYRSAGIWPTLQDAVSSNQRLFVIIDKRVRSEMYTAYMSNLWIHSEHLLQSTWRGDVHVNENCQQVVENSKQQCQRHRSASLLEISILGYTTACVTSLADLCLPHVHQISRDCQDHRHAGDKAPNVLLVDFPERAERSYLSVVSAANLQNVRNVARLVQTANCHLRVDAAVIWKEQDGEQKVIFFSGSRLVIYNWHLQTQENLRLGDADADRSLSGFYTEEFPASVDAAFKRAENLSQVCFTHGCDIKCFSSPISAPILSTFTGNLTAWGLPCHIQAAFSTANGTFVFKGCQYWQRSMIGHVTGPTTMTSLGLPCDIDAALQAPDEATYFFKAGDYWKYSNHELSTRKSVLEWSADFLQC